MVCCFLFSSDRAVDQRGRYKTWDGPNTWQTPMLKAPCHACPMSCLWCCFQFIPFTMCCAQYALRVKVLEGDMTRYSCFQGYFDCCCCIRAGSMGESSCPELCLCLEACCCNSLAVSASRALVMDQYDIMSDPCDNRLINFNNCIQCLACLCDILAIVDESFRGIAFIIDHVADLVYHSVSGCMTAQVAVEIDYQRQQGNKGKALGSFGPGITMGAPGQMAAQGYPPQQQPYPGQGYPPQQQPYPGQGYPPQQPYPGAYPPQQGQQVVYVQGQPPPGTQVVYVQGPPPGQQPMYR